MVHMPKTKQSRRGRMGDNECQSDKGLSDTEKKQKEMAVKLEQYVIYLVAKLCDLNCDTITLHFSLCSLSINIFWFVILT